MVLVCDGVETVSWPLAGRGRPHIDVVDELARLQLAARRLGCSIWLRHPCPELLELLELVGMSPVLGSDAEGARHGSSDARSPRVADERRPPLGQVGGEAECGEQVGVEEVVVPDDPVP